VEIEAHIGPGVPGLQMVGLPDTALSEARDRVRAAVLNRPPMAATQDDACVEPRRAYAAGSTRLGARACPY
jgi:magnesium chelatase family protein